MNNLILIALFILAILIFTKNKSEGYDSVVGPVYYSPRAYPNNVKKLQQYPFNYQPYPMHGRFDTYEPYFYRYGYGHY